MQCKLQGKYESVTGEGANNRAGKIGRVARNRQNLKSDDDTPNPCCQGVRLILNITYRHDVFAPWLILPSLFVRIVMQ